MKHDSKGSLMKNKLTPLFIGCLLATPHASAIEIYQDDDNSVSLRGFVRLTMHGTDDSDEITDSGSRWGIDYTRKIQNDWTAGLTMEWATNFEKNTNLSVGGDSSVPAGDSGDSLSSRLGYIHFTHDKWGSFGIGKQWSVYYDVVAVTDVLNFFGGNATGAYNLGSDGGLSGTGRAEQAITWRKSYGNLNLGIQLQAQDEAVVLENSSIPEFDGTEIAVMGNGYSAALTYQWHDFTVGGAVNISEIDISPVLGNLGAEDEEDTIFAASVTYGKSNSGLHVAFAAVTSEYHEVDNTGNYIDAVGSELFVKYTLENKLAIYGGYNLLESDTSSSDYELSYSFAGAEYPLFNGVGNMFIEAKVHDDTNHDNSQGNDDTQIALGIKFNL